MTGLSEAKLRLYLEKLASAEPAPGGGAAAALTAAQAAALLAMACNLTGPEKFPAHAKEIQKQHRHAREILQQLTGCIAEDGQVFSHLMDCYKMPRQNDELAARRKEAIQAALRGAVRVPRDIMRASLSLLPIAGRLAEIGNPNLISDVGVALHLIRAAVHSAELNVRINCKLIQSQDAKFVKAQQVRTSEQLKQLEEQLAPLLDKTQQLLAGQEP